MNVIFWAAVALFILGAPRLVWAFVAANKRVTADIEFYNAIPADAIPADMTGPAIDEAALHLLKTDPEAYFAQTHRPPPSWSLRTDIDPERVEK